MRLNALDRLVSWVSPQRGLRRMQYRRAAEVVAAYEGASRGRRTEGWKTRSTSANAEVGLSLAVLRNRARDLVRNNPYAAAAVREIPAHMIGPGLIPQARARNRADTQRAEALVKAWFDTPACDADGRHDFYGLQTLVARTTIEAGECLVRRRLRRPSDGLPVPMQLQVLEPDHLDTMKEGVTAAGNLIIQGIEFNAIGRRVAYWLFPEHPGNAHWSPASIQSRRIPAEEIIHVYRTDRPGQVRGVPWLAPVIIKLRDFADYEDAQLQRQKIAACFAAFITNPDPMSADSSSETELPEKLEPGLLEELPAGRQVEFNNPPPAQGYDEYTTVSLHSISTGIGVPYAVLTGDLRKVNFSSGRMGWLSFNRNLEQWRSGMLVPQLCMGAWNWFVPLAQVQAGVGALDVTWTAPRREMVDPAREVPAIRDQVRSGQITLFEGIRQMGYDPEDFLREVEEGNRRLDELGIVLDSDPRKVSRAGLTQSRPDNNRLPFEDDEE